MENTKGVLNLRGLDIELIAELKVLAYRAHVPLREYVARALREAVRKAHERSEG